MPWPEVLGPKNTTCLSGCFFASCGPCFPSWIMLMHQPQPFPPFRSHPSSLPLINAQYPQNHGTQNHASQSHGGRRCRGKEVSSLDGGEDPHGVRAARVRGHVRARHILPAPRRGEPAGTEINGPRLCSWDRGRVNNTRNRRQPFWRAGGKLGKEKGGGTLPPLRLSTCHLTTTARK